MHRVDRHRGMEGETRQDRRLLRGVVPLDIRRRVGLRVAQLARASASASAKSSPSLVHAVQHVVRRAVHDAEDAPHLVAGEAVAQRADDRDRAADRGLVVELRAHLLREVEELGPMGRGMTALFAVMTSAPDCSA